MWDPRQWVVWRHSWHAPLYQSVEITTAQTSVLSCLSADYWNCCNAALCRVTCDSARRWGAPLGICRTAVQLWQSYSLTPIQYREQPYTHSVSISSLSVLTILVTNSQARHDRLTELSDINITHSIAQWIVNNAKPSLQWLRLRELVLFVFNSTFLV